jgi:16S rRNA C967 or C1407 C5-methylase (RsmB/RsmF family)/NOL1/NOP2/fmu family ribosome biogenesis protein
MQLPQALIDSLTNVPGFDAEAFVAVHHSDTTVTSVRVHPNKTVHEPTFTQVQSIPWCSLGYYLQSRPSFISDPFWHAGAYYVQEASSMFLWHILQQLTLPNTAHVLDVCAAPGGKTTLLQSYFQEGVVVANEVIKQRNAILVENLARWGSNNTIVTQNDPQQLGALRQMFDLLVIDAPCSGSGLFRKDKAAVAEWSEANVALCSARQQRIVADVLPALADGGYLIYSTCSYSEAENEQVVDAILSQHPTLKSVPITIQPEWGVVATASPQKGGWGYRFYPYRLQGEGFFVSIFQKEGGGGAYVPYGKLPAASKAVTQLLAAQGIDTESVHLLPQGDYFLNVAPQAAHVLAALQQQVYVRKAGVTIGNIVRNELIPHPELALSVSNSGNFPRVEVGLEDALQYLRKQPLPANNSPKGWAIVTYKGLGLGFMKVLPNRTNNYYPTEWRILKY